jgi:hypothetical protein
MCAAELFLSPASFVLLSKLLGEKEVKERGVCGIERFVKAGTATVVVI